MTDWKKIEIGNTWNYKDLGENAEFIGLFTGKEEGVGENNSTVYSFEQSTDNEPMSVWGSTVLDTRMKNVKVGEEVKIVYKGQKDSPNRKGKKYHDFEVFHRPAEFKDTEPLDGLDLS